MAARRDYFSRKVHSLLGVIPIGLFLIVHLSVNYYIVDGVESFNKAAKFMESLPYLYFLEVTVIALPMIFHGVYGVYYAFLGSINTNRYSYARNWMYMIQRFTGVFLVIFIAWHVWETRLAKLRGVEVNAEMMQNIVDNPLMLIFYIVGILSATFHFANGLWSFAITWGITQSPRSQRFMSYVSGVVFLALSFVGIRSILTFAGIL
ncbi:MULTISPECIES: succinate dehydrogenase cytochrome b558 subunit [Exiguobacterium]|uniref:Succinate dehydrogenase cytochrome b558 subunit n=1 Tax=Exiguobacterium aurantiacum TaxID=33987 RepID=A0ABY5FKJ8_9BACL|nr:MULTISPECIES: succinate dehydrogenase cytochrome b558 subunit [Exiguobacterium]UTT42087.1 succinate dehydrogenase cytochrome b558 subunit [Exiguobacterium aurantiacum]